LGLGAKWRAQQSIPKQKNENTGFIQETRKGTRQALTDGSFFTSVSALFN